MKAVVIIPTYNEKENIAETITTLIKIFGRVSQNHQMHILVIDGNSPDGTQNIVNDISKIHPNVHLLLEKGKRGLGAAYKDAMDHAFSKLDADAIITFDADLSHDPEKLPLFIEKLEQGAKYVCGTRYRQGGGIPENWGVHRKLISMLGNFFIRCLYFRGHVTDFTSGYKAISKEVYDDIGHKFGKHSGYTFAIATNLETLRGGYKIEEIPYHFKDRRLGKSKMGAEYMINALIFVIKSRIKDIVASRFGKVFVAGGFGSVAQFISYGLIFRPLVENRNLLNVPVDYLVGPFEIHPRALFTLLLAIEVGVFTSFYVNNSWAFKDNTLNGFMFWRRFIKNHFVVAGAILIQLGIFQLFTSLFGRGFILDYVYQIFGILVGLIWNFYFYKKIIWKIK